MRISYLAATTLAVCFLPLSTPAFAGCNSTSCAPVGKTTSYSSTYGSTYGSGTYANQGISTRFIPQYQHPLVIVNSIYVL